MEVCITASLCTDQLYNAIKYHSGLKIKKRVDIGFCFSLLTNILLCKSQIKAKHTKCKQNILFNKLVDINGTFSLNDNLDTINTLKAETT